MTSWAGKMPLATVLALNLSVALKYVVEPRQLSRFYGLKDTAALRRAAVLAPLLVVTTYVCLLPLGALAHALLPSDAVSSSDEVVPVLLAFGTNLPLYSMAQNQIWCAIVALACELTAWLGMLALPGAARRWEPKKLRTRVLSTAGRLVRSGRRTTLKLPAAHPWTQLIIDAVDTLRGYATAPG